MASSKHECDCGAVYSSLAAIESCQINNHGRGRAPSSGSVIDKAHESPSASTAKASPTAGGVTAPGGSQQPKWNAPLKVRQMFNDGTRATDGSGWQWEVTDRHGELIAEKLLRQEAEYIVEACNGYAALQAQNAELVKALPVVTGEELASLEYAADLAIDCIREADFVDAGVAHMNNLRSLAKRLAALAKVQP